MYIVNHSIRDGETLIDYYSLHETKGGAKAAYDCALCADDLYCAAISKVVESTEPHWKTWRKKPTLLNYAITTIIVFALIILSLIAGALSA